MLQRAFRIAAVLLAASSGASTVATDRGVADVTAASADDVAKARWLVATATYGVI
eukprot:gene14001-7903_t